MADEQPSLHIDTDWKKQAQEEKRRLAEQAAKATPAAPVAPAGASSAVASPASPGAAAAGRRAPRGARELPPAGFASLVQSLMTQVLYYLGDLSASGGQPMLNLDMAKHQLDTLSMLEEKTKNNLSDEEKTLLDAALYETRSRFIAIASQLLGP